MRSETVSAVLDAPREQVFDTSPTSSTSPNGDRVRPRAAPRGSDELFEAQHASLRREFENIERLLGG